MREYRLKISICLFLIVATLLVYGQLPSHDFIDFDDGAYVIENPYVSSGFTKEGLIWAFDVGNWHPLTWLSHMLDCELFGLNAGWHHLINLLFHIANTLLLFLALGRMTGDLWRSGIVAVLFALHPLNVESVAWVSERKNTLSTFFWMLTIWSYVSYAERPRVRQYFLVLIFFALALMAKPMVVTLPFVLLLMDVWPLGRLRLNSAEKGSHLVVKRESPFRLVWEKIPLFVLSAVLCVMTLLSSHLGKAIVSIEDLPLKIRIANALVSYITYMKKMIWSHDLGVFYPFSATYPTWKTVGAGVLLMGLSIMVFVARKKRPYLAVGWLWYLGTLIPVIGLVQAGVQSMADRYTYIPMIGLFIMVTWGVPDFAARWRYRRLVLSISACLLILGLMVCTLFQVGYWKDSISLFKHTVKVTSNNYVFHNNLGVALANKGKYEEAIRHFKEVLKIKPGWVKPHYNLGLAKTGLKRFKGAIEHFYDVVRLKPDHADAHHYLGIMLFSQGRIKAAVTHYQEVLKIKPDSAAVHYNLGIVLMRMGHVKEAAAHFDNVLRINPDDIGARRNLERALLMLRKADETNGIKKQR